jgi:hypothetical protein
METLIFPRLVYHESKGTPTDYGYGYTSVKNQTEFDNLIDKGWYATSMEVPTNIFKKTNTALEPDLDMEKVGAAVDAPAVIKKKSGRPKKAV